MALSWILVTLVITHLSSAEYLTEEKIDSASYLTYLTTNVARFIAFTTHRVTCPRDPGLLHGEHLQICLDSNLQQADLDAVSNQSLHKYLQASETYSDWIDELKFSVNDEKCSAGGNLELIAERLSKITLKDFWPFNPGVIKLNQKLGILGISQEVVKENKQLKEKYFESVALLQNTTLLPVKEDKLVLSFDDGQFVKTLVEKNYAHNSVEFMFSGQHLYEEPERSQLYDKATAALQLIKELDEDLHECIVQAQAAIGFYKGEDQSSYTGGTTIALLGAVWMDPPQSWTVVQLADGIVHEYIHTALNEAELVHGMVADDAKRKQVKTTSSIRRESRPYDKSFHAAYVATGLALFHSHSLIRLPSNDGGRREEHMDLLGKLLETLGDSIKELKDSQSKHRVLSSSGEAMLDQMVAIADNACII